MKEIDFSSLIKSLKRLSSLEDDLKDQHLWNALSLMHQAFGGESWVGLYVDIDGELLLGPFQGTPACERIAYGKGVVGSSFSLRGPLYVEDVSTFPGYICCDASAKSEVCVFFQSKLTGRQAVLDIDFPEFRSFEGEEKEAYLELADLLSLLFR